MADWAELQLQTFLATCAAHAHTNSSVRGRNQCCSIVATMWERSERDFIGRESYLYWIPNVTNSQVPRCVHANKLLSSLALRDWETWEWSSFSQRMRNNGYPVHLNILGWWTLVGFWLAFFFFYPAEAGSDCTIKTSHLWCSYKQSRNFPKTK